MLQLKSDPSIHSAAARPDAAAPRSAPAPRRTAVRNFTRHYAEMLVAMFLGMFVLGAALAVALGLAGVEVSTWRAGAPALLLLGMAFTMTSSEEITAVRGRCWGQFVHGVVGPNGGGHLLGDGRRDGNGQRDAPTIDRSRDVLHVELHRLGIGVEPPALVTGPVAPAAVDGRGDLVVEVKAKRYQQRDAGDREDGDVANRRARIADPRCLLGDDRRACLPVGGVAFVRQPAKIDFEALAGECQRIAGEATVGAYGREHCVTRHLDRGTSDAADGAYDDRRGVVLQAGEQADACFVFAFHAS